MLMENGECILVLIVFVVTHHVAYCTRKFRKFYLLALVYRYGGRRSRESTENSTAVRRGNRGHLAYA